MYDLVLLDLDGTLVDTAPDIADTVNRVLHERGLRPLPEPWVRDRIGYGARELLIQAHAASAGAPHGRDTGGGYLSRPWGAPTIASADDLLEEFARHYARYCGRRGRLYQDVAGSLELLRRAGVKLALLTNKEAGFAEFVLQVHGLDGDFDLRVCGDTLAARKPDPQVVRHCLATLGVKPGRALLVGDSDIDVQTARNAGIAVWAVPYGYNRGRPIADWHPDRIIPSLRVLADAVVPAPEAA